MANLNVGAGKEYRSISSAVNAAKDRDTINVQAGTYRNDYSIIDKDLTFNAVGGRVKLESSGNIPNGKAIFVIEDATDPPNVSITGFDFYGAKVRDKNGAGIRHSQGNLIINNSSFFNNENGILTGNSGKGSVTIKNSEFAFNGTGSNGQTHNLYVGRIDSLTVENSYFHDVKGAGHEIKSRADNNIIKNSRIYDNDSTASYSIDLPEGGNALIENNVIQQGKNSPNNTIISYGSEGNLNPGKNLVIKNNDIINDKNTSGALGLRNPTDSVAQIIDNDFYGLTDTQISTGKSTKSGSEFLGTKPILDKKSPLTGSISTNPPPVDPKPEPNPNPNPNPGTNIPTDNASLWSYAKSHPDEIDKLTLTFGREPAKVEILLNIDPDGSGPAKSKDYKTSINDLKGDDWSFISKYISDPENGISGTPIVKNGTTTISYTPDNLRSALSTDND
jgi:hypothetical protein